MFLFTTPTTAKPTMPVAAAPVAATPVTEAIKRGATATGTDFDYLLRTAKRESALDPTAKAPTSSATGLFQFIEQTWLGVMKNDGPALGLGDQASAIVARPDGRYDVPDPAAKQAILRLREQPDVASTMAGALTRRNREALQSATGKAPSNGELYLAHVLGARGAGQLITAARANPDSSAAAIFPEASRANRSIFYAKGGAPRSVSEVYAVLTADRPGTAPTPTGDVKLAVTDDRPPGIYGLFQTGARQAPVSDAVARIWRGQGTPRTQDAAAVSFFPRSKPVAAEVAASAASGEPIVVAQPASAAPVQAPVAPSRSTVSSDRPVVSVVAPIVQLRPATRGRP